MTTTTIMTMMITFRAWRASMCFRQKPRDKPEAGDPFTPPFKVMQSKVTSVAYFLSLSFSFHLMSWDDDNRQVIVTQHNSCVEKTEEWGLLPIDTLCFLSSCLIHSIWCAWRIKRWCRKQPSLSVDLFSGNSCSWCSSFRHKALHYTLRYLQYKLWQ